MATIRYAKTPEQVKKAAEANPEFLSSTVRSVRCVYETDPAIIAAVPSPLWTSTSITQAFLIRSSACSLRIAVAESLKMQNP